MNENPNPTPSAVSAEAREAAQKENDEKYKPCDYKAPGFYIQVLLDSTRTADRTNIERLTAELANVTQSARLLSEGNQWTITRLESELASYRSWGWSEDNLPPSVSDWNKTTTEANELLLKVQRLESELVEAKAQIERYSSKLCRKGNRIASLEGLIKHIEENGSRGLFAIMEERDTLREKLAVFDDPNAPKTWNDMIDELLKLRDQLAASESKVEQLCQDWADNHTGVQNLARPFGIDVGGSKHGVPGILDIAEALAEKLAAAENWMGSQPARSDFKCADDFRAAYDQLRQKLAAVTKERETVRECLALMKNYQSGGKNVADLLDIVKDWVAAEAALDEGEYEGADGLEDVVKWAKSERDEAKQQLAAATARAERLAEALRNLLKNLSNIEVLGEWEVQDINCTLRKTTRAKVDAVIAEAHAALAEEKA